ncbi:MAG: hypothetical protein BGO06_19030 [Shinella sp. 65-6]|nr:MAG: hypothetical protein BGO06_19030 [Shinella sp. 65-6]
MSVSLPEIEPLIARTADQLDREGFVCLENAVPMEWLESARQHVRAHLDKHGEKFFSLIRPADEAGSPFDTLVHDPRVRALMRGLTQRVCPQGVVESEDIYNVLRVIAGPEGTDGACQFHYDASVVTILVPIFMPDPAKGPSGELVTLANRRPYRSSALVNLAEKALVQNRYAWRRTEQRIGDSGQYIQLLQPGNLYLFWGYRTYHGNLPCAPNSLRATLLLHYGNPHGNTALMRWVRDLRKSVEARRLSRT